MKKTLNILFALISLLVICLTSCSNDVAPLGEGTLVINIGGGQERGITPISMSTAGYELTVTDSLDNDVISTSLGSDVQSVDYKLPAGSYVVKLDAKNSNGDVIGTGSERVTVVPGETNVITITIREAAGDGVFAVSITANSGYELSMQVFSLSGVMEYDDDLQYVNGVFTTKTAVALENGFYRFVIKRKDTDAVVKTDSLRIVKGQTSTYTATFSFTTNGGITIVNEVLSIPVILITLDEDVLDVGGMLVASAEISGINDYTACWFVDGVKVGDFGDYDDFEYGLNGMESGEHEVSLYVKNSQVLWSECKTFTIENNTIDISTLSADQWLEIDPDKTYSFVNMDDGALYAIEFKGDGGRSIGTSRGLGDALILDTGIDKLLVPDENRKNSGTGASYGDGLNGLLRIFQISVANPNLEGDLSVELNENDFSADACDEWNANNRNKAAMGAQRTQFYHVNFNAPAFRNLDASRIFMVVDDAGGWNMGSTNWGIVTLGNGISQGHFQPMYMYDFSNVPFINIYHEFEAYFTQDRWEGCSPEQRNAVSSVLLLNPVDLSYTDTVSFGDSDRIFCIPEATDDKEYVLEVTGCDLGNMIQLTDSSGYDYDFAYCLDNNAENKSYLLGKITEEVFFDLDYFREEGGSFSIREAGPEDKIDAIELDSSEYEFEKTIVLSQSVRSYSATIPVKAVDDYVPSNLVVSISALDSSGNEVDLDSVHYYFKAAHTNGVGFSTRGYDSDPCIRHKVRTGDILKSIEVTLRKNGLIDDLNITLRIEISDGNGVFMAGESNSYQEEFEVNVSGLTDKGFFINMDTGSLQQIDKNEIFWYVIENDAYDSEATLLRAASEVESFIESEGINLEVTDFLIRNNGTRLRLRVDTNRSGSSTEDKKLYFIYAQYTGEGVADFSTLKSSDLVELAKKELVFLRGK